MKINSKALRNAKAKIALILFFCLAYQAKAFPAEVYLKNNDRITGEIVRESETDISIKTEAIGTVTVKKDFVECITGTKKTEEPKIVLDKKEDAPAIVWKREVSAGYNYTRGNVRDDQLSASLFINRNRMHIDEITLKGNAYYSALDEETNAQKFYGLGRYAFSFGKAKAWYNFYSLEADHDRFSGISYRLIPAAGVGYWFYDLPGFKLMAEAGIGIEHTDYKGETEDTNEMVIIPRAFFEKDLFGLAKISQDVHVYPVVTDPGEYRLRSESALIIPGFKKISVRLSFINEYNSNPPEETKKLDRRFMSSLVYSF